MASDSHRLGRARWSEVGVLAGPAMLLFLGFVILPLIMNVVFSFSDTKLIQSQGSHWVGLDNYARLFSVKVVAADEPSNDVERSVPSRQWRRIARADQAQLDGFQYLTDFTVGHARYLVGARDPRFLHSIVNTITFVILVVPLQSTLAFLMALWVNRRFPGRTILRTVFFAPVVTSMVVVSAIWGLILHPDAGLLNQALRATFGDSAPQPDWLGDPSIAMLSIAVMSAWQGAGFQMLIFLAGLQGISKEQYEAAELMGANSFQKFFHITLPGLKRTIVFVVLSTTIAAFSLFTQVDVLTHGGPRDSTSTIVFHAVREGFRQQDIAYGSAMSLFFLAFVLLLSLLQRKLMGKAAQ